MAAHDEKPSLPRYKSAQFKRKSISHKSIHASEKKEEKKQ